jgi:glycosyltransferase involved in cell wall biosynthesis
MVTKLCFFVGTHGDWGGASRILFNLVRHIDRGEFQPVVMLSRPGPVQDELERLGVDHHVWPRHDFSNPFSFARDVITCLVFLRRQSIDLIHLNHGCIGWRPAELAAARMLGIPIVQHSQQPVDHPSPDLLAARVVLTCSDYLQTVCDTASVPKRTLYDLVDLERFGSGRPLRDELGIAPDQTVFSFIGRTRRRKGLRMFVDLALRLRSPKAKFLITGQRVGVKTDDSYSEAEVLAMIGNDQRIHYLGFRDDIENVYATSDVVVMPSQHPEPCPAVLIESAAAGKPVIATDVGSTDEFVRDGGTGFVVAPHDLDALVERAARLLDDGALRERIGFAARRDAQTRFFAEPLSQIQALYRELRPSRRRTA